MHVNTYGFLDFVPRPTSLNTQCFLPLHLIVCKVLVIQRTNNNQSRSLISSRSTTKQSVWFWTKKTFLNQVRRDSDSLFERSDKLYVGFGRRGFQQGGVRRQAIYMPQLLLPTRGLPREYHDLRLDCRATTACIGCIAVHSPFFSM